MDHLPDGKRVNGIIWRPLLTKEELPAFGLDNFKAAGQNFSIKAATVFAPHHRQSPLFTLLLRLMAVLFIPVATLTSIVSLVPIPLIIVGRLVGCVILAAIAALLRDQTAKKFFDVIRRLVEPAYRWIAMVKLLAEQSAVSVQLSRQILAAQLVVTLICHHSFPRYSFAPASELADSASY